MNVTQPDVILRELQNRAGAPYDSTAALREIERLDGLEIFSNVGLESKQQERTIDLQWKLHEMPPLLLLPDASNETNGGIALGFVLFGTNLTGRNIKLTTEFLWGKTKNYTLEFENPWIGSGHYTLKVSGDYHEQRNEEENFFEKSSDASVWFGRWFDRKVQVEGGGGLLYLHADDTTKTLSRTSTDGNGWVGIRGTYDHRNETAHPTSGMWLQTEYKRAFAQSDYSEYTFDFQGWVPMLPTLYWSHSTLIQLRSGEIGQQIPVYERFRLGGSETVRGYSLDELGERQAGKNETISTTELRWRFLPRVVAREFGLSYPFAIEAALFVDIGEAWNVELNGLTKPAFGGGAGLRFLVPAVKEIRVDYARGEGGTHAFMLTLGKKEKWQRERIR